MSTNDERRKYKRDYARRRYHEDPKYRERALAASRRARTKDTETEDLYREYYRRRKAAERHSEPVPRLADIRAEHEAESTPEPAKKVAPRKRNRDKENARKREKRAAARAAKEAAGG
jgi:hypothetical protein